MDRVTDVCYFASTLWTGIENILPSSVFASKVHTMHPTVFNRWNFIFLHWNVETESEDSTTKQVVSVHIYYWKSGDWPLNGNYLRSIKWAFKLQISFKMFLSKQMSCKLIFWFLNTFFFAHKTCKTAKNFQIFGPFVCY